MYCTFVMKLFDLKTFMRNQIYDKPIRRRKKKKAVAHFTTKPCEPYTAYKVTEKPYFYAIFVSVLTTLCTLGLKILELKFSKAKNYR